MNQAALNTLKRLYNGSEDWMIIVDEAWVPVWSTEETSIPDIQKRLFMRESDWQNTIRPFSYQDTLYECHIQCSYEDGLRVLRFQPALRGIYDFSMMTQIIQGMVSTCTALFQQMEDVSARDLRPYLNMLMMDILRVYRMLYLEREIERGSSGQWENASFGLLSVMRPLYEETRNLMRHFADVSFASDASALLVKGDLRAFRCAALSALLLCFRKPEYRQTICISLYSEEQNAIVLFRVTPDSRKRADQEGSIPDFGDLRPEQLLLDRYCGAFDIQTEFMEENDTVSCRMTIPLAKPETVIQFHSGAASAPGGFFDPVHVMLARIHFYDYF